MYLDQGRLHRDTSPPQTPSILFNVPTCQPPLSSFLSLPVFSLLSSFSPVLDRPSGCKYSRAFRLSSIANLSRSCSTRLDRRRIEERRGERSCTGIRERRVPLANYDRGVRWKIAESKSELYHESRRLDVRS